MMLQLNFVVIGPLLVEIFTLEIVNTQIDRHVHRRWLESYTIVRDTVSSMLSGLKTRSVGLNTLGTT